MGNGGLKVKDNEATMGQWHGTMGDGGFMTNQQKKPFFKEWMSDKGWCWGGEMQDARSNHKGVGMDTIDKPIKTLQ
jgi:hypothetical protein